MVNYHNSFGWIALHYVVLLSMVFFCSVAFAGLGEDVSSVQIDGVRMKAEVRLLPSQGFAIHELSVPSGTHVREFVSPSGQVFGISWQGPYAPDLRQLLGQYFEQYMQAAQTMPRIFRRGIHLETGDLVFESGGHMRFMVGRAYLRSKLPDGVSANDVR